MPIKVREFLEISKLPLYQGCEFSDTENLSVTVILPAFFSKIKYCEVKTIGCRLTYEPDNTLKDLSHCDYSFILQRQQGIERMNISFN